MLTIIRNARVLCMDDSATEWPRANVLVRGGKIEGVGPDVEFIDAREPVREIDGAGHLVMPGLINGHFHSPVNLMKGSLDSLPLEIFMLYESPALEELMASPRVAYVRTMLGAIEMLKNGVTAVQDDAFYVPHPTPEVIDGVMQAYLDSGIRATAALDQANVVEYKKYPYLADLLPEQVRRKMDAEPPLGAPELTGLYRHLIARWHGVEGGRIRAAVSCSAPQRVTVDYFETLDGLSKSHDLPFYIHILETKLQRVLGTENYGKSLIQYVGDLGLLSERTNVIHAIWVDDADMDLLASTGAVVAHSPLCNLRLGSGVMPFRKMRDRGIPICLGSDEAIADDSINMWSVAKMAGLVHNITEPDYEKWPGAQEILQCMIRGGARAMRQERSVGVLAPGFEADLIMLDLNTIAFTPLNDVRRQLVYCENGSSVRLTMVAGKVVMEKGRILTVDEEAVKAEAREIALAMSSAAGPVQAAAAEMMPYYREMYLKAARQDTGINRWVGDAWRAA